MATSNVITKSITRRTALTQIGAAAALVSVQEHAGATEIAPAAEGFPSEEAQMNMIHRQSQFAAATPSLVALIEAHKTAHAAFNAAIDREYKTQKAYFEAHPKKIMVPLSIGGELPLHVNYDLDQYADECREDIIRRYDGERKRLLGIERIAPQLAATGRALLDEKQTEDIKNLRRLLLAERRQQEASGYAAAAADLEAKSEAEMAAAEALLSHPCRSAADGQIRADYIMSRAKGGGGIIGDSLSSGDERLITALLLSTARHPETGSQQLIAVE